MPGANPGLFRAAVFLASGLSAGIVGFTATAGLTDARPAAWAVAALAAAVTVGWLARRPGSWLADVPGSFQVAFVLGAIVTLGQLLVLTPFAVDPYSTTWHDGVARPMAASHSCVSAYWVASEKAKSVPDIYLESVYRPRMPTVGPPVPNLGPFMTDAYEYPPTFLPLPRLLAAATGDFWHFRSLWFALNLAGVVAAAIAIGLRLDKALGTHTVWLTPWVLAAPSMIGTLQVGNVQLLFIAATLVAMLLFERDRPALGGLLLGYAIASKLYPGVFIIYLLVRRQWKAVAWTAATGIALAVGTFLDIGWAPFAAFLEHLPKLLSGEAFPALYRPAAVALNESIPGLVFKLGLLGVPNMSFGASRIVGWLYSVVLLVAVVRFARRPSDPRLEPLIWLAILMAATLRSPFLPSYGAFPALWVVTLMAGVLWTRPSARPLAIGAWLLLALHLGQSNSVPANFVMTCVHTVVEVVVAFYVVPRVVRKPPPLSP
jgi:hypothetical protein